MRRRRTRCAHGSTCLQRVSGTEARSISWPGIIRLHARKSLSRSRRQRKTGRLARHFFYDGSPTLTWAARTSLLRGCCEVGRPSGPFRHAMGEVVGRKRIRENETRKRKRPARISPGEAQLFTVAVLHTTRIFSAVKKAFAVNRKSVHMLSTAARRRSCFATWHGRMSQISMSPKNFATRSRNKSCCGCCSAPAVAQHLIRSVPLSCCRTDLPSRASAY